MGRSSDVAKGNLMLALYKRLSRKLRNPTKCRMPKPPLMGSAQLHAFATADGPEPKFFGPGCSSAYAVAKISRDGNGQRIFQSKKVMGRSCPGSLLSGSSLGTEVKRWSPRCSQVSGPLLVGRPARRISAQKVLASSDRVPRQSRKLAAPLGFGCFRVVLPLIGIGK